MTIVKAFQCDKCGDHFTRGRLALEKTISFDGPRGPRTLEVDLLYRCAHKEEGYNRQHRIDFCDDCLLWLIEEYKGSIMVEIQRGGDDVTEDSPEFASA